MEINNEGSSKGDTIYFGTGSITSEGTAPSNKVYYMSADFGRIIRDGVAIANVIENTPNYPYCSFGVTSIANSSGFVNIKLSGFFPLLATSTGTYVKNCLCCIWIGASA